MRLVIGLAGTLLISVALQQGRAQAQEKPLNVSLCEVKAHPEHFLHKLIEVTATASHGFEDSMVEDGQCPWPSGGPGVWMEYGGTRTTNTMYCCGFSPKPDREKPLIVEGISLELVDDQIFKEFDRRLHPRHAKPQRGSDVVVATMRGRVFARYEGIGGTQQSPAWRGYGHMGCCMLFVVTQVVSLNPPR
jgi:hypothetical protein